MFRQNVIDSIDKIVWNKKNDDDPCQSAGQFSNYHGFHGALWKEKKSDKCFCVLWAQMNVNGRGGGYRGKPGSEWQKYLREWICISDHGIFTGKFCSTVLKASLMHLVCLPVLKPAQSFDRKKIGIFLRFPSNGKSLWLQYLVSLAIGNPIICCYVV